MFTDQNSTHPNKPRQVTAVRRERVSVGHGYRVSFSYCDEALRISWEPSLPLGATVWKILPKYVKARNTFLAGVMKATGNSILIGNPDDTFNFITKDGIVTSVSGEGC